METVEVTKEEIISNPKYHTCGRCKYDYNSQTEYPCNQCIHGFDTRKDMFEYDENR